MTSPDSDDLIVHRDLAPWNMVLTTNRWVFIDWDGGPRITAVGSGLRGPGFIPLTPATSSTHAALRLAALQTAIDWMIVEGVISPICSCLGS